MKKIRRNYKKELIAVLKRIAELEARLTEARRHLLPFGNGKQTINFLPLGVESVDITSGTMDPSNRFSERMKFLRPGSGKARLVVIADIADGIDFAERCESRGKAMSNVFQE